MQATGEVLDGLAQNFIPKAGGFPAQVMGDGPTERRGAPPQLFAHAIARAQRQLTISTPYFVPDATVLAALCTAALRDVEVTLIFPESNDSRIVAAASRSYHRKLLEAGCVIYEYTSGLLHAKTLTIDGQISFIGSSNLDLRSFDLNYENNILLQDACPYPRHYPTPSGLYPAIKANRPARGAGMARAEAHLEQLHRHGRPYFVNR